jgi:hypothetical protein
LNTDGPTAPARSTEAEIVFKHLQLLVAQGIKHVYLAVDAISPSFLNSFADCLIEEKLDLHWSTQFFITRQFSKELIGKLESSGLRVASFGLESGSSRVLEWMGKGANRVEEVLRPAFASFRASPIGLQPLFFFGFPGETDDDRHQTARILLDNEDVLSTISKGGQFDLLPGSIVARTPERFGVTHIRRYPDDDIAGALEYELASDGVPPTCGAFRQFNELLPHWSVFERPWAGGIDTLHTQLYIERFGRGVFHKLRRKYEGQADPWGKVVITTSFNLDEVLANTVIHDAVQSLDGKGELAAEPRKIADAAISAGLLAPLMSEGMRQNFELQLRQYREI